ncbi:MAG: transcription elongation factor GreA [Roseiflexaceae bacterium]
MTDRITYLTREGKEQLEAELKELETVGRREIAERINAAKELGDISESGEYEDAKKASGFLEGRIKEINDVLRKAHIIEEEVGDVKEVRIGRTVVIRFEDEDADETYRIVGSAEANPAEGRISNESPLGRALIDRRVKDKVVVQTPNGPMKCVIKSIK